MSMINVPQTEKGEKRERVPEKKSNTTRVSTKVEKIRKIPPNERVQTTIVGLPLSTPGMRRLGWRNVFFFFLFFLQDRRFHIVFFDIIFCLVIFVKYDMELRFKSQRHGSHPPIHQRT